MKLDKFLGVEKANSTLLYRAYFAFFVSGMMANVLGSLMPCIVEEYRVSLTFQGTVLSANQVGNLLAVWLSGYLPYAIGRKKSTLLLGSGIVLGFVGMVLTGNPVVLLVCFVLLGLGRGTMSNITNVVVGETAGNKVAGLNLLHGSFAVGAFISPFLVVLLGSQRWNLVALIIAAAMAVALVLLGKSSLTDTKSAKDKGETSFPKAFSFWLNTFILFCYLCAETTFMGWLVTYFTNQGIFPSAFANALSALLWLMILVSRLLTVVVSEKVKKERIILFLGACMTLFTFALVNTTNSVLATICVLCIGLSMGGIYPTTLATMEKRFSQSTVAIGLCIGVATLGAVIMPSIVGYLAQNVGMNFALRSILIPLSIMLVLQIIKLSLAVRAEKRGA